MLPLCITLTLSLTFLLCLGKSEQYSSDIIYIKRAEFFKQSNIPAYVFLFTLCLPSVTIFKPAPLSYFQSITCNQETVLDLASPNNGASLWKPFIWDVHHQLGQAASRPAESTGVTPIWKPICCDLDVCVCMKFIYEGDDADDDADNDNDDYNKKRSCGLEFRSKEKAPS